jgi:DNA-binding MarR family transcriptional regulator
MNPSHGKRLRQIKSVDQSTGEVLDGVVVYCAVKQNPYANGWIMNSQEALETIAKDKDFTGETLRVLMYLLSRLDFDNWIHTPLQEIADRLGMKRPNVSKAVNLLESKGILIRGPKIGRSYAFRLNPYYGWKGKVKNLDDYRRKQVEEEVKNLVKRHKKNNLQSVSNKIQEETNSNNNEIKDQPPDELENTRSGIEVARKEILKLNADEPTRTMLLSLLDQMDEMIKTQPEKIKS